MAHISYRPDRTWLEGRYLVEVVDDRIHLRRVRLTLRGACKAGRRLERQAARHRRRMRQVEAVNQ